MSRSWSRIFSKFREVAVCVPAADAHTCKAKIGIGVVPLAEKSQISTIPRHCSFNNIDFAWSTVKPRGSSADYE